MSIQTQMAPQSARGLKPVDDALPFDFGFLEIDQQTQPEAGGWQIVEALRSMLVGKTIHAFQFDHQDVLDEDVGKILADRLALVGDNQRSLGRSPDATKGEFPEQGTLVDFFEESGAESI